MFVTKIVADFSRSINTANHGGKESWIKIGSTYEAQIESSDDPKVVSQHLTKLAEADVTDKVKEIIQKLKGGTNTTPTTSPANPQAQTSTQQPRTY